MTFKINYTTDDGLQRVLPDLEFESAELAIAAATDMTQAQARTSSNPIARIATDKRVTGMRIQKEFPYSNLLLRGDEIKDTDDPIKLVPALFDRLDEHHEAYNPRLDMDEPGKKGIIEFCEALFPIINDFWDSGFCDIQVENLEAYDEKTKGFILYDYPGQIIDTESPEGEEYIKQHKIQCTEEVAGQEFDEKLREFEAYDLDDNSGNIQYWISLWFTPEKRLRELAKSEPAEITRHAQTLLGLTDEQMDALVNPPRPDDVHFHARPAGVAAAVRRFIDTGKMSWAGLAEPVECCEEF